MLSFVCLEKSEHFWTNKLLQLPGAGCTLDLSATPNYAAGAQGVLEVVEPPSARGG